MLSLSLPNLEPFKPFDHRNIKQLQQKRQNKSSLLVKTNIFFQNKSDWLSQNNNSYNNKTQQQGIIALSKLRKEFVDFNLDDDILLSSTSSITDDVDLGFKIDSWILNDLSNQIRSKLVELSQIQELLKKKENHLDNLEDALQMQIERCGDQTLEVYSLVYSQ